MTNLILRIVAAVIVSGVMLIVYSCCKVAGDCAREEEQLEKEGGLDK